MDNITILWADDEIDVLKPQILFLEEKGYSVVPVTNGQDAIEHCRKNNIDIIFLDEHMPGLSGLETLEQIKGINSQVPVVMITKNEEEDIMEQAIGAQITDYLIKPVKPKQILLTLKKIIDNKRLVTQNTTSSYQQEFQKIFMAFTSEQDHSQWAELYKRIVDWELKLDVSQSSEMMEVHTMQKTEANSEFNKFILANYQSWLENTEDAPVMSHTLMKEKVFPEMNDNTPVFMILIDNLRMDQWKTIKPYITELFNQQKDEHFYSILPTTTQYSRNAIFSGLMPLDMQNKYPELWIHDIEKGGKNLHENDFLSEQLKRYSKDIKHDYIKITNFEKGKALTDNFLNYLHNDLTVIVYNFVDMLSHARTEMEVLKELASDESAYRSITRSWFLHSPLYNGLKKLADKKVKLIFTSDHGTIRVKQPSKVIGDRNTTTNLRYKHGRNLQYNEKEVMAASKPHELRLPAPHVSSTYIFAKEDRFFAYPNNYNYYVNYYKNTFQHGGISLEEMIVPVAVFGN